jgi:hypothetical protein
VSDDHSVDPHGEFHRQARERFGGPAMLPPAAADPHADYRRQAAERFGAPPTAPTAPPSPVLPPPRIYRDPAASPVQPLPQSAGADNASPYIPAPLDAVHGSRLHGGRGFPAGTTYTGTGVRQPNPSSVMPPQVRHAPSVPPRHAAVPPGAWHAAGPATGAAAFTPEPMAAGLGASAPTGRQPVEPIVSASNGTPAVSAGSNIQPQHVLWALAALSLICVVFSTLGWLLVAAGFAVGGWYVQTRGISWPAEVEDVLVPIRLTRPTAQATAPSAQDTKESPIPFRPMTLPELFSGAFKIVAKNWPVLIGIPVAILAVFLAVFVTVMLIVTQMMTAAMTSSLTESADIGSALTGLFVMIIVMTLVMYALALPADALLIALSVIATDKAVRGQKIQISEVFRAARSRIFAVCRLTLAFYTIFLIAPDLLLFGVLVAALGVSPAAAMPLMFGVFALSFMLAIVLSLAPIVLVVEGRGVADSMKRSALLAKPAWGRLLGIHLLWAVCVTPLLALPSLVVGFVLGAFGTVLFMTVGLGVLIAYFRTLQMLIYTDLRMRQESYDRELLADWTRNTG